MLAAGIYDPYLHILGGAERYILSIALCLKSQFQLTIFGGNKNLISHAERKFGLNLSDIKSAPWIDKSYLRNKLLSQFALFIYVTDGSIFHSPAQKNFLLIQSPIHIPKKTIVNLWKLTSWTRIICYSDYIAKIIEQKIHKQADLLFVPINNLPTSVSNKTETIISVGRFFPHLHNKKQLEMVQFFKRLVLPDLPNIKLILVGSVDPGGKTYADQVKQIAQNLPVEIFTQTDSYGLNKLYSQAKIYWHAAGYGEDLGMHPERAEHFGVVTLEAMAHKVVPIVFAAGGQTEIVKHGINGYLWRTPGELKKYTLEVLQDDNLRHYLAHNAFETAKKYNLNKFCERLNEILK